MSITQPTLYLPANKYSYSTEVAFDDLGIILTQVDEGLETEKERQGSLSQVAISFEEIPRLVAHLSQAFGLSDEALAAIQQIYSQKA